MYLPPIEPNCNYEPFVSGDVTIAPDAAIAPGVIIQAGPDGRIVIASGVCIGMGAIIHAYNGIIEIEEGATIGAGVLVVGQAKIAAKACIGSLSTLINAEIEPQQTIAAASILGDTSRQMLPATAPTSTSTNGKEAEPISSEVATTPSKAKEAEPISSEVATTPSKAEEAEPISFPLECRQLPAIRKKARRRSKSNLSMFTQNQGKILLSNQNRFRFPNLLA